MDRTLSRRNRNFKTNSSTEGWYKPHPTTSKFDKGRKTRIPTEEAQSHPGQIHGVYHHEEPCHIAHSIFEHRTCTSPSWDIQTACHISHRLYTVSRCGRLEAAHSTLFASHYAFCASKAHVDTGYSTSTYTAPFILTSAGFWHDSSHQQHRS